MYRKIYDLVFANYTAYVQVSICLYIYLHVCVEMQCTVWCMYSQGFFFFGKPHVQVYGLGTGIDLIDTLLANFIPRRKKNIFYLSYWYKVPISIMYWPACICVG